MNCFPQSNISTFLSHVMLYVKLQVKYFRIELIGRVLCKGRELFFVSPILIFAFWVALYLCLVYFGAPFCLAFLILFFACLLKKKGISK